MSGLDINLSPIAAISEKPEEDGGCGDSPPPRYSEVVEDVEAGGDTGPGQRWRGCVLMANDTRHSCVIQYLETQSVIPGICHTNGQLSTQNKGQLRPNYWQYVIHTLHTQNYFHIHG